MTAPTPRLAGWRRLLGRTVAAPSDPPEPVVIAPPRPPPAPVDPVLEIRGQMAEATDDKLLRVVALVDRLPHRGSADTIIAPVRRRIAALRPPRPLSYPRLLFVPAGPLIVSRADWRAGSPGIPRTAIIPLSEQLRGHIGAELAALAERGASETDTTDEAIAGQDLWPKAAAFFRNAPTAAAWLEAAELSEADHAVLVANLATILRAAPAMMALSQGMAEGQPLDRKQFGLIMTASDWKPDTAAALMVCVMSWAPETISVMASACKPSSAPAGSQRRHAFENAIDFIIDQMERATDPADLAQATQVARRVASLVAMLERQGTAANAAQKRRAVLAAGRTAAAVRRRFVAELEDIIPLKPPAAPTPAAAAAAADRLDASIAALNRLGQAGRQLGIADQYERPVLAAMARVRALGLPEAERDRRLTLINSLLLPGPA
jgi:hypothetical protein